MPGKRTETLHAGFTARFRDLSVPGPLVKYSASSAHTAPTPAECGRPSGRAVATKKVRSDSGVSLASRSRGRLQGSGADPYRSRLRVEVGSVMVSVIPKRRTGEPPNRHVASWTGPNASRGSVGSWSPSALTNSPGAGTLLSQVHDTFK